MNYGTRSELEVGFDLIVKKVDPFGIGMTAEEMFPEFAEEAKRVGIDNKEYEDRINSMGFLPCVDALNPDELFFVDDLKDEENAIIFCIDHPEVLIQQVVSDFPVNDVEDSYYYAGLEVVVLDGPQSAKKISHIRKRTEFILVYMPNGAAVFM
ncbi:MAG: hypothetical protein HGA36_01865 [Candidatus Moranbacteria bacterium]|nr:hypothetical protein [Candidatus Moranbacteria bacterium]